MHRVLTGQEASQSKAADEANPDALKLAEEVRFLAENLAKPADEAVNSDAATCREANQETSRQADQVNSDPT